MPGGRLCLQKWKNDGGRPALRLTYRSAGQPPSYFSLALYPG